MTSGYANGTWDKTFVIPPDKSSFGPFDRLDELSKVRVRAIVEKAASSHAANGTPDQQIGDFYTAYMDETAIEAKDLAPAQPAWTASPRRRPGLTSRACSALSATRRCSTWRCRRT